MKAKKLGVGALILSLMAGSFVWGGNFWITNAETGAEETTETQEAIEKEYPSLLASASKDGEMAKDETVYVISDADGSIKETVVSEWLRNGESKDSIDDVSILKDIENTANDKSYTQDGDKLVWAAGGSDIKYKGTTDEELPVSVNVSYYLEGKKMNASEIAGKSGNVEILFTYKVNTSVSADGYEFKTPYIMASGVLLDDEHFTDINVEGGKVIDDGSKCICLGLAFPNMTSNLNTDLSSLEIPEKVSIKAYTDSFEIDGTYTVAMTGLLSDIDLSGSGSLEDKISSLESALGQLGDASSKLVSGAAQLSDGADELDENATTLKNGAKELADGTGALKSGSKALQDGANQLSSGASSLSDGTSALKDGSASLAEGTGQLKSGSSTLSSGLDELSSGSTALKEGVEQYVAGAGQLVDGISQAKSGADSVLAGEQAVNKGLANLSSQGANLSSTSDQAIAAAQQFKAIAPSQYSDYFEQLIAYANAVKAYTNGVDTLYQSESDLLAGVQALDDSMAQLEAGGNQLTDTSDALTQGAAGVEAGTQQSAAGAKSLADGAASADAGAKSIASGAAAADDGAKAVASGASEAANGARSLAQGASDLDDGASTLADGAKQFKSGTSALSSGARELYDGIKAFDAEGIQKLISTLDDAGIENLFDRLKALADASKDPGMVDSISKGMSGQSRIIVKTEAVKAE